MSSIGSSSAQKALSTPSTNPVYSGRGVTVSGLENVMGLYNKKIDLYYTIRKLSCNRSQHYHIMSMIEGQMLNNA